MKKIFVDNFEVIVIFRLAEELRKKGLRPISVSDLGLSVLYVSTDKYCNPEFSESLLTCNTNTNSTPRVCFRHF